MLSRLLALIAGLTLAFHPLSVDAWPVHGQVVATACGTVPAPAAAAGFSVCNFAQNSFSSANVDTVGANPAGASLRCGMWFGASCTNEATFSGGAMVLAGNATTAASNVVSANPISGCTGALSACFHGMAFQNGGYFCATIQLQNNFTDNAFWGAWWSFSLNHILQSIPSNPDIWVGTNAAYTASIASTQVMNVTAVSSGNVTVGTSILTGAGATGIVIDGSASQGSTTCNGIACTGTGGTGTYHVNTVATVGSEAMTTNPMQWFTESDFWEYNTLGARFTGHVSGTTLTIDSLTSGSIQTTMLLVDLPSAGHVPANVSIVSGSGSTWTLSQNLGTIASESMSAGYNSQLVNNEHVHYGQNNISCSGYCDISTFDAITVGQVALLSPHEYCERIILATGSTAGSALLYIDGTLANTFGNNVWGPPAGVNNGTVLPPPSGSGTYSIADVQPVVLSVGGTDFNNYTVTGIRVYQHASGDMLVN